MTTALDLYVPFDAGAGANLTEDNWRKMARHWLGTGVLRGEDNELQVYGDSSGMQVKVKTGKAWVRGHYGESTAEKTLAIAVADATNPRIDVVVLRADFDNNLIELVVLTGTPAGSPVAPAVTQSSAIWEVALAQVAVAAAAVTIAAGNVTDARLYAAGADDLWTPAKAFTPVWINLTVGNGVQDFWCKRKGDEITVQGRLTFGSTTSIGGSVSFGLPVAAGRHGALHALIVDFGTRYYMGGLDLTAGSAAAPLLHSESGNSGIVNATNPVALGVTDWIKVDGSYFA